ncbi:MAG: ParB/RepB/Spo0J family partition protein [Candidatus Methanoplasma sp.]|jgi:ParB/RepB/Spo0J family partition protein|nr:ParB/RepB/Spo0J family partition protein [Candidatus Methanoplasma sp.]
MASAKTKKAKTASPEAVSCVVSEVKHPVYEIVSLIDIEFGSNVRKDFSKESMAGFIENVRVNGILEPPILLRKEKYFELISGERRLMAAKALDMSYVVCAVYDELTESEFFEIMMSENLHRMDLNPIEEAIGLRKILDCGMTQEDLASRIGKSQEYISNRIRLLEFPEILKDMIISREINPSHAFEFMTFKKYGKPLFDEALKQYSSVNQKNIDSDGCPIPVKKLDAVFCEVFPSVASDESLGFVYNPDCYLGFAKESEQCYHCPKYFCSYCLDKSCLDSLIASQAARIKAEKKASGKAGKADNAETPEQIASRQRAVLEENALQSLFAFFEDKVFSFSSKKRMEIVLDHFFSERLHFLEDLNKKYPAFALYDGISYSDMTYILCMYSLIHACTGSYDCSCIHESYVKRFTEEHSEYKLPDDLVKYLSVLQKNEPEKVPDKISDEVGGTSGDDISGGRDDYDVLNSSEAV